MRRPTVRGARLWLVIQVMGFVAVWPAAATAQRAADVPPAGARVRLRYARDTGYATAEVVRAGGDTLWVLRAGAADTIAVPRASLRALDVSRGERRQVARGAGRGLLMGAAVGGMLGAGLALADREDADFFGGVLGTTAFFAGLGAVPGVVLGALTGLPRREVWVRVPLR